MAKPQLCSELLLLYIYIHKYAVCMKIGHFMWNNMLSVTPQSTSHEYKSRCQNTLCTHVYLSMLTYMHTLKGALHISLHYWHPELLQAVLSLHQQRKDFCVCTKQVEVGGWGGWRGLRTWQRQALISRQTALACHRESQSRWRPRLLMGRPAQICLSMSGQDGAFWWEACHGSTYWPEEPIAKTVLSKHMHTGMWQNKCT